MGLRARAPTDAGPRDRPVATRSTASHQAGIVTPAQDRLHFAAFDVTTDLARRARRRCCKAWTVAAAADDRRARPVGGTPPTPYDAPPSDTGEAIGPRRRRADPHLRLRPVAVHDATARTASASPTGSPRPCGELPHFPADNLDPTRSDGDLCVQACADDPQVAVHAIRNLVADRLRHASRCGGRSSASAVRRRRRPRRRRRATCSASRTAPPTSRPRTPTNVDKFVWVAAGRRRRVPTGWPAAPTSSPAGSTCTSRRGTAPASASRRRSSAATARRALPLSGGTEFTEPDFDAAGARRPADRDGLARAARAPDAEQRRADAAPRLQLHRRQRRPRPPRRRPVLHRLRARPRRAVHPDAEPAVRATTG